MPKITACSTLAFSLSTLEVALEHIQSYGVRKVEIADMLTHSKHFQIDDVDPLKVRELLQRYALAPVAANVCSIAAFDSNYGQAPVETQSAAETEEIKAGKRERVFYQLLDPVQAEIYRKRAEKLIEKAQLAGIPKVTLQGGRRTQITDIEKDLFAAARVLDQLAAFAQARGVQILLEMPHVWGIYYDLETTKKLLSLLSSESIGVLIDSTHWHVAGYDIDDYLDFLGSRLRHIHLRDAAGKDTFAGNYELEKTPGRGEVDFAKLGQSLDAHHYQGEVTLETEYKNYKSTEEVDRENLYALRYLKSIGWHVASSKI